MIETISRGWAMAIVKDWHASPRMKTNPEAVSARKVPRGQYIFHEKDGTVGAIDNSEGLCLVENFDSLEEATAWLRRAM